MTYYGDGYSEQLIELLTASVADEQQFLAVFVTRVRRVREVLRLLDRLLERT